jgi:hypothetical protein
MIGAGIHTIPDPVDDILEADPLPPAATDPELEARILRELAERDAALEG